MLDDTSLAYLEVLTRGDTPAADQLAAVLDAATELERQARDRSAHLPTAALAYARNGVAVFPLHPRGKTPLTSHGFKDATTDPDQVTAWWAATPDANIGVPTGHGFDVIDVDGTAGLVTLYNGARPIIDDLDVIGVAQTSRDGGRHLYVPASGRGNKAGLFPGVDYRGVGGYVVAPPSIGANGRRYQWAQPLTVARAAAA